MEDFKREIDEIEARCSSEATSSIWSEDSRKSLGTWLVLLEDWNTRIDLTAAKTREQMAEIMLVDALVLAREIEQGASVVDVGTGAGAPGLALAFMRPDLRVTLIEPLQKRVSFLSAVLDATGRSDVTLVKGRAEGRPTGTFDHALARAVYAPDAWLPLGRKLIKAGGGASVWLFLTEKQTMPELRANEAADVHRYVWPFTDRTRLLARVRVEKAQARSRGPEAT